MYRHTFPFDIVFGFGLGKLPPLFTDKLKPKLYIYCQVDNFTAHFFLHSPSPSATHSLSHTLN